MQDRHNIDDLFRERLKDHSLTEDGLDKVWHRIEKKRTVLYITVNHLRVRWKLYSMAAILLAMLSALPFVYEDDTLVLQQQEAPTQKITTQQEEPTAALAADETIVVSEGATQPSSRASIPAVSLSPSYTGNASPATRETASAVVEDAIIALVKKEFTQEDLTSLQEDLHLANAANTLQGEVKYMEPEIIKGRLFAVDFLYSPDFYLDKKLEAKDHLQGDDYEQLRKSTESIVNSYAAAVRLNYQWNQHFSFQTGLHYYKIKEQLDAEIERTIEHTLLDTTIAMYATNGGFSNDKPNHEDDNIITIRRTYRDSVHLQSTYEFIDIPFMVGYHIGNGKLKFNLYSGITYNLSFKKRGFILNEEGQLEHMKDGAFKQRSGLSLYTSAGLSYAVTPKIEVLVEPSFRYGVNGITTDEHPLSQRYCTFGINSGLRFNL